MKMTVNYNNQLNGIEVYFNSKPSAEVIAQLKEHKFRWNFKKKCWYTKISKSAEEFLQTLNEKTTVNTTNESTALDLWKLTRTENIENNYEKYHMTSAKEIASTIRKHLRKKFYFCKWSVTSDINSINIHLVSSPFSKDSVAAKAIAHYAYIYTASYNYNNSDYMIDYFDVNFYTTPEQSIICDNSYIQTSTTDCTNVEQEFIEKKAEYEAEQVKKKEERIQKQIEQEKLRAAENAKLESIRQENHSKIEDGASIKDVDYFVLNCNYPGLSKENTIDAYLKDTSNYYRGHCKVAKEVYLTSELYNMFTNQLLDNYAFLEGMGGTDTDDLRIKSDIDYSHMSESERKTVEFYSCNCVAVYCDNVLKLVIDPQGYSYARYVYFVDEQSQIKKEHLFNSVISREEMQENKALAERLEDASAEIILKNDLFGVWNTEKLKEYKELMKEWISQNNFDFSVKVIRALSGIELKKVMYKLLYEYNGLQEQFKRADFKENQKITIIQIGDFGSLNISKVYFKSYECESYAQYDNAVKMVFKPEKKRKLYYNWYYRDVLIYDGWLDIPDNLLWEEVEEGNFTIRKSRFLSCDVAQYDTVIKYFKDKNISPVVNTYKP